MNSIDFKQYWQQTFTQSPPVGYILRSRYSERWMRLHTLPHSKRHPENEMEYQEVLRRHNALLDEILQEGHP
jgi:hypothetical protein